ncbi:hypothetical protein KEM48_003270 [Puccinia striiformis f. sp. tritici PST-130]|nr:hypothetical protein KEM48_003270 [Puccinia striiformis f. sp. tritici PST-130]
MAMLVIEAIDISLPSPITSMIDIGRRGEAVLTSMAFVGHQGEGKITLIEVRLSTRSR